MEKEKKKKESFVLYKSDRPLFNRLSDAEGMILLNALFDYMESGGKFVETGNPAIDMAMAGITYHIDVDWEKWLEKSQKSTDAANARWHPNADGCERIHTNADGCERIQTDAVIVNDMEMAMVMAEKERGSKRPPAARFVKPSVEDIKAYCREKGYSEAEAQHIYDYYESNGWKVGKNPMKDWKAAVRNWFRKDFSNRKTGTGRNRFNQFEQHEYDFEQLEGLLRGQ